MDTKKLILLFTLFTGLAMQRPIEAFSWKKLNFNHLALTVIGICGYALIRKLLHNQHIMPNDPKYLVSKDSVYQIRSPFQGKYAGCTYFAYRNTGELIQALLENKFDEFIQKRSKNRAIMPHTLIYNVKAVLHMTT